MEFFLASILVSVTFLFFAWIGWRLSTKAITSFDVFWVGMMIVIGSFLFLFLSKFSTDMAWYRSHCNEQCETLSSERLVATPGMCVCESGVRFSSGNNLYDQ